MSRAIATEALSGAAIRPVFGLAWVHPSVARGVLGTEAAHDDADAVAGLALSLGVDLAFAEGESVWGPAVVAALHRADIAAVWTVTGVMGRVAARLGWTDVIRLSAAEPGVLAVTLAESLHEALDDVRAGISAGADAIAVADDLTSDAGWLVAPDFALDALIPVYARLATEARAHSAAAVFHSDGDSRALFPALANAGYSAVHVGSGGDRFPEVLEAARRAGLVVLGGIDVRELLSGGARESGVRAAALAEAGGLIVCDDGGIDSMEGAAELAVAFREARREMGL